MNINILAFDLGGSGGRMLLCSYDENHIDINIIHQFEQRPVEINGALYWDIFQIWKELNTGIEKAIEITGDAIDSLGIDSFCNDFACMGPDGELLTPVRCYRDRRTQVWESQIYKDIPPDALYEITGNQTALFNSFMQMASMVFSGQGYQLYNAYKIVFVPDLLIHFLTGKWITEYTLASVSQLYCYDTQSWSTEILKYLKLTPEKFGGITPPGTIVGPIKAELHQQWHTKGFNIATVCSHDTASAFLSACAPPSTAIISSGTWAIVGIETKNPLINANGYKHNIANEGSIRSHHRLLKNVMGTWIIQEIRAELKSRGENYSYYDLEQLAAAAPPLQWLIDVDDVSFYQPGHMLEKVKSFCRSAHGAAPDTLGEIVRSIYEGLAIKYRMAIEALEETTGIKIKSIRIVGGGSKSSLQNQLTANICGLPVVAGPADATAYGNIMVQLVATKAVNRIEDAQDLLNRTFTKDTYIPDNSRCWESAYRNFIHAFCSSHPAKLAIALPYNLTLVSDIKNGVNT